MTPGEDGPNDGDAGEAEGGEVDAGDVDAGEAGAGDDERGPLRRCIVTGVSQPPAGMVRFVVSPEGEVVPDVASSLPGRGIWLSARRDVVNTALVKKLFAKAARKRVEVPPDLADRVDSLLARRCLALLGLACRAGQAFAGYEKVRAELKAGRGRLLLAAADAAEGGRGKVRALAPDLPLIEVFTAAELGHALGRDACVHVMISPGRLAATLLTESSRLAGFRGEAAMGPVKVGEAGRQPRGAGARTGREKKSDS